MKKKKISPGDFVYACGNYSAVIYASVDLGLELDWIATSRFRSIKTNKRSDFALVIASGINVAITGPNIDRYYESWAYVLTSRGVLGYTFESWIDVLK